MVVDRVTHKTYDEYEYRKGEREREKEKERVCVYKRESERERERERVRGREGERGRASELTETELYSSTAHTTLSVLGGGWQISPQTQLQLLHITLLIQIKMISYIH